MSLAALAQPPAKLLAPLRGVILVLILFLLSACAPKPEPAADPSLLLPPEYTRASAALAEDDFAAARESFIALANASSGDLQASAQAAASATDIEAMRASFKTLTEDFAVNLTYPDDHAVAFCPLYKEGSKWIQKREAPIANPYLGKSQPSCGSFVD